MVLQDLHLLSFKSWEECRLELSDKINCFVGRNGSGKTNLLDAIHYLCLTKGYFGNRDLPNIKDEQEFFVVEGNFLRNDEQEHIYCALKKGAKKVFKRNKKDYGKLAEHIGRYPAVVISPYDRNLILDASEVRRRFMDGVISQGNPEYLHHLMRYNKALQHRNALLKFFAANNTFDQSSLELYDHQLAEHGAMVHQHRLSFREEVKDRVVYYYQWLSNGREEASLEYLSALNEQSFEAGLKANQSKDRQAQYSTFGTHKDDLEFTLNQRSIKQYGSQGQQKSFLIALKLAQYEFLKAHQKQTPLLLLDDIFDKLDEERVARLVKLVHDQDFGQIFITDTHPQRTADLVRQIDPQARVFQVDQENCPILESWMSTTP